MGRGIRIIFRFVLIMAWSIALVVCRFGAMMVRPFSPRLDQRCWQWLYQTWARGVARLVGMRIEVRGTPPKPPFFLVSNHLTFMDVFLLASQFGCTFVSRGDVQHWPVFGFLAKRGRTIFIDRERPKDTVRVNAEIRRALEDGYAVAVFPEGGVSHNGQVRDFRPALLEPAAQLGVPVYAASIYYETPEGYPPASEIIVWKEGVSFLGHYANVSGLPYFRAVVTINETPVIDPDRKRLAQTLCGMVRAQFTPLA